MLPTPCRHLMGVWQLLAKVAVSAAVFAIDRPYSYRIPETMQLFPGQRVIVPFGRGNRRVEGVVLSVENGETGELKAIESCLDVAPILNEHMLRLAAFLRARYFCTYYDAVRAILPAGFWFKTKHTFTVADAHADYQKICARKPQAADLMTMIASAGGAMTYDEIVETVSDRETADQLIAYLVGKNLLCDDQKYLRRVKDRSEMMISLAVSAEDALAAAKIKQRSAPMQAEVLQLLANVGTACMKDVQYFTGANTVTVKRLETLGLVLRTEREITTDPLVNVAVERAKPFVLNDEQQAVFDSLSDMLLQPQKPALLFGVTGSGKTAVYICLIEQCLAADKTALLLVPEIGLTPQFIRIVASHFGREVAVIHSALRIGARFDEWNRIRAGKARVVVGTRSAVFAPLQNLGLIIMDEEQEHTYKSENAPRYHARDVAIYRGSREKALVLFGSATPSIESMSRAKNGDYAFFELKDRYNGKHLPMVEIADLREELHRGNSGSISGLLLDRLQGCLDDGRQAILFLNRRGNSRFSVCVDCGETPGCPRCSVKLTYHSANRRLMCHHCGFSQPMPHSCPNCGGRLKLIGAGTQRVEEELAQKLPNCRVLRMDTDSVSAAHPHEAILQKFAKREADVLLGTQMVAKGLDFANVTLVGVLDADQSLYAGHFRAAEMTFSMLTQVIGRAGRGESNGMAVVQTMTPENSVIRLAAAQDYLHFFDEEIAVRRVQQTPPFSDCVMVRFFGAEEQEVIAASVMFRDWIDKTIRKQIADELRIFGPSPAPISKVNQIYHYRMFLYGHLVKNVREMLAHLLREFARCSYGKTVHLIADWNPYE